MAITARLEMRQGQQLVMTPQLQQAIRLLQLSNMELSAFVETELERNPLLERDDQSPKVGDAQVLTSGEGADASPDAEAGNSDEWLDLKETTAASTDLDTDYENVYADSSPADLAHGAGRAEGGSEQSGNHPETAGSLGDIHRGDGPDLGGGWSGVQQRQHGFDNDPNLEAFVAKDLSLKDHLVEQLQMMTSNPTELLIGRYIIDMVDDAGYLPADFDELADKLGAEQEQVEAVLVMLQDGEPIGVPSRGLAECLALQLKDRNRYDPIIMKLLENLHLLAQHNLSALKRIVGVDMDELAEMIAEIKALDPKPGLQYGSTPIQPVIPDVIVRAANDGSWIIELNSETLPRVLVDRTYYAKVSTSAKTSDDKIYLQDCLQTANWLAKSLDQRARTILRVSEEIVRQQDGFFTHGVQFLRPLNLKTIAEAISMHESTISRVTSNKYMATPRGILELKFFFSSAIASSSDGETHSSESVRHRIKALIDAEKAETVLSDDKIVNRLKADGIDIARRTVAKYREAMKIPSSVQRRREKRLLVRTKELS